MKTMTRIFLATVAMVLFLASSVIAEETPNFVLPMQGDDWLNYYQEVELDNIDRIQEQVKSYEADIDMADLPDFDIYVFEDERSLEEYARLEADIYGAPLRSYEEGGNKVYSYASAELYDDEWYIVRNNIFALENGTYEEICAYHRTEKYTVGDSDLTVRIPLLYKGSDVLENNEGIYATFVRNELLPNTYAGNPIRIDLIEKEIPDGLGADDVLFDYATRTDSLTEIVTVNGKAYYKIVGPLATDDGNRYSVLYLYPDGEYIVGVSFLYENESNGLDLAIMETTGF